MTKSVYMKQPSCQSHNSLKEKSMSLTILSFLAFMSYSLCLACQYNNFASINKATTNGVKFHLHDERTNNYLIVDFSTLLLRVVNSEEFEASKQDQITWFTACNDFSSTPTNHNVIMVLNFPEMIEVKICF